MNDPEPEKKSVAPALFERSEFGWSTSLLVLLGTKERTTASQNGEKQPEQQQILF